MKPRLLTLLCLVAILTGCYESDLTAQEQPGSILDPSFGEPVTIREQAPPNGMQLIQILINHADVSLYQSELCLQAESDRVVDGRTLRDQLAMVVWPAMAEDLRTEVRGACHAAEITAGEITQNVWDCRLTGLTTSSTNPEFFESRSVAFTISRTDWRLDPSSLRCF